MIRKILGLALLGFLVVTLAGPVFTLLGLALVGFIAWGIFRTVFAGQTINWQRTRGGAMKVGRGVFRSVRFFGLVLIRELGYLGRTLGHNGAWLGRAAWERARSDAPLVGGFLVEVVSGAAMGGLLGLAVGWRREFMPAAIGIGAAAGAALGILVGILNWRARRRMYASYS